MYRSAILLLLAATFCLASPAGAVSFEHAMKSVDPQAKYLFYLHGGALADDGQGFKTSNRYGEYLHDAIVEHFEDRGLVVVDDIRTTSSAHAYAAKITRQVRIMMTAGIPARNITVSGFSEGGHIALLVASGLGNPDVGYVIMAGCGKGRTGAQFKHFLKTKRGMRLKGRIFSIYAGSDLEAGSCRPAMAQASGNGLQFSEVRLKSNKGHGLFFQPRPVWINPTAIFARGGR